MTAERILSSLTSDLSGSNSESGGVVAYLLVDRADRVRDRLGYSGLLALVRQVRKVLLELCGEDAEVRRFGLESLVVRVPALASEEVESFASKLFEGLGSVTGSGRPPGAGVTFSVCVSRIDQRYSSADDCLIALARRAEELEASGGNGLALVEPDVPLNKAMSSTSHMIGLLMESLRSNSLKVMYQPIVAISEEQGHAAYQALPRLESSDGRLIAAGEFIKLAREASLLHVLEKWMVSHAVSQVQKQPENRPVRLFVSISDALFADKELTRWLKALLKKNPGVESRLVFQIPVAEAMGHLDAAAGLIRISRTAGCDVCLNGVDEHSRWDLFRGRLQCGYLRMSAAFVSRLVDNPQLEQRFLSLSDAARDAGCRIIMPMIEDTRTAASIWRSGADYMQGNLIQEPIESLLPHE